LAPGSRNTNAIHKPGEVTMFSHVGLPQFAVIVVVLIVFLIYTQRHRF
jgi:Na+/H+ antiporter NhaC